MALSRKRGGPFVKGSAKHYAEPISFRGKTVCKRCGKSAADKRIHVERVS